MFGKLKRALSNYFAWFLYTVASLFSPLVRCTRAIGNMMKIIGLAIGLTVASALVPDAIVELTNSSLWSGAPTAVVTLGTVVLGIIAVVALIRYILD